MLTNTRQPGWLTELNKHIRKVQSLKGGKPPKGLNRLERLVPKTEEEHIRLMRSFHLLVNHLVKEATDKMSGSLQNPFVPKVGKEVMEYHAFDVQRQEYRLWQLANADIHDPMARSRHAVVPEASLSRLLKSTESQLKSVKHRLFASEKHRDESKTGLRQEMALAERNHFLAEGMKWIGIRHSINPDAFLKFIDFFAQAYGKNALALAYASLKVVNYPAKLEYEARLAFYAAMSTKLHELQTSPLTLTEDQARAPAAA